MFYQICKKLNLSSDEIKRVLLHLKWLYPYGEHATLSDTELEEEINTWLSDQEWLSVTDDFWNWDEDPE